MTDATNWYTNVFKTWQVKLLGPKPTADQLAAIHNLGARPGKQALANAMGLRDCGVTNAQIVMACGAPQLNKMRGFIVDGLLKRLPVAPSSEGHTVYKLELTPKGNKRIEAANKRAAELEAKGTVEAEPKAKAKGKPKAVAKAKGKPKAKVSKPKAKPEKATSDAPNVTDAPTMAPTTPDVETPTTPDSQA